MLVESYLLDLSHVLFSRDGISGHQGLFGLLLVSTLTLDLRFVELLGLLLSSLILGVILLLAEHVGSSHCKGSSSGDTCEGG